MLSSEEEREREGEREGERENLVGANGKRGQEMLMAGYTLIGPLRDSRRPPRNKNIRYLKGKHVRDNTILYYI